MVYLLSQAEKKKTLEEFYVKYKHHLDVSLLSDLFGKKVNSFAVEPLSTREDGKLVYMKAKIQFEEGEETRFWKHYLEWGPSTNRSGVIFRNPFTEKNEDSYLQILGEEGFAPKYDWTYYFKPQTENGAKKTNRLISMEFYDMDLMDFISSHAEQLNGLKQYNLDDAETLSSLEACVSQLFKMAINIAAFNDAVLNRVDSENKTALMKKIRRIKKDYNSDLLNFINAISGVMFAENFDMGSSWDNTFGERLEVCLEKYIAEPLSAFPELAVPRNIRLHPEHVLIKDLSQKVLMAVDTTEISDLIDGKKAFPYTNFAITDHRAAITTPAFSYSNLLVFTPVSGLDIGITPETRKELFEHAIFADYSLMHREFCQINRAPLKDFVPAHMTQANAAEMYYLLFDTYMLAMYFDQGKMAADNFKERMNVMVGKIKDVKGDYGSFEIIGEAFQRMYDFIFGRK